MKKCPYCSKPINNKTIYCRYCRSRLSNPIECRLIGINYYLDIQVSPFLIADVEKLDMIINRIGFTDSGSDDSIIPMVDEILDKYLKTILTLSLESRIISETEYDQFTRLSISTINRWAKVMMMIGAETGFNNFDKDDHPYIISFTNDVIFLMYKAFARKLTRHKSSYIGYAKNMEEGLLVRLEDASRRLIGYGNDQASYNEERMLRNIKSDFIFEFENIWRNHH